MSIIEFNEYFTSVGQKTAEKAKEITTTSNPPFDEYLNEITTSAESPIFSFEPVPVKQFEILFQLCPKTKRQDSIK